MRLIIDKWQPSSVRSLFMMLACLMGFSTDLEASEKEYLLQLIVAPYNDPYVQSGGYLRLKNIIGSWIVNKNNVFDDEDYNNVCLTIRLGFKQDKAQSYHLTMLQDSLNDLYKHKADLKELIRSSNDESEQDFYKTKSNFMNMYIEVREKAISEIDTYLYRIDCVELQGLDSLNNILTLPR
jgi:hypothetical protein